MLSITLVLIISAVKLGESSGQLSEKTLNRANIESQYIARVTMITMFEETERYIRQLYEYIQSVETRKFKKKSKENHDKFMKKYGIFINEAREIEKIYVKIREDAMDDDILRKFNEQIQRLDKSFTDASKAYTKAFRGINASLTKLDPSKIMYTDAEIFKTLSKILIRTTNHLIAMEKLIEIVKARADECGTISNRDGFYEISLVQLYETKSKIEDIFDSYPDSILKENEYDDMIANYEKVKEHYEESIKIMVEFDKSLGEKYESQKIKYNNVLKKTIELISKLPFRLSAFVTPSLLGTFIISFLLLFQM
ncbi:conserved hypothetical protein [Theileria orientalis strain Shintoku]|uniref:Uncharacterized protein n=1 Tax=Theileria orientalis strain Shintoku TaxID=869250 RepID=J4CCI1_THEOR|nr:conserved hypothetical protein [Theileria orientalis strain Shintoku]BAM39432.1 conserved hypothetical protein [Theileria orientalis strain Shintoku]|eukprot:XP_009689733.1 conserved hypothetical protein [Theileria orientalis strain Shintoku]